MKRTLDVASARVEDEFSAYAAARHAHWVRTAVLLGLRAADADDAAQSALTKVWVYWRRVQAARSPDAYAYKILVNEVKSQQRRAARLAIPFGDDQPAEHAPAGTPATDAVERRIVFRGALDSLSDGQRQVLVLRFYGHLSEAETATTLGIPLGTVKSRCNRALDQLGRHEGLTDLVQEEWTRKP